MPVKSINPVVPFYFGREDRKLFGCLHEPHEEGGRRCAVLICQPIAHEYINSHRALRQLASRLAASGFPVLRFDYYGCGDSSGEIEQGSITRWLEDISTAVAELRARTGIFHVCVVGVRLGATLAALAGSRLEDFAGLVLWEPIVSGSDYLNELVSLHQEMLRFRARPKRSKSPQVYMEVLGFPLSRFLHAELEELDLAKIMQRPAPRILVVRNAQADDESGLQEHLLQTRARVEHQKLNAPEIWLPTPDGSLIVPAQVLQSLVSWVSGASL
jgi:pimeloyl-ACP methyl ester carboxylesterase